MELGAQVAEVRQAGERVFFGLVWEVFDDAHLVGGHISLRATVWRQ